MGVHVSTTNDDSGGMGIRDFFIICASALVVAIICALLSYLSEPTRNNKIEEHIVYQESGPPSEPGYVDLGKVRNCFNQHIEESQRAACIRKLENIDR